MTMTVIVKYKTSILHKTDVPTKLQLGKGSLLGYALGANTEGQVRAFREDDKQNVA